MSKDIKKALEHCVEWNCDNCPNREELGSGEIVCRGRLLPEVLEYVADLEAKLAECEKSKESYRLQNEHHYLQLLQFYSRLGVEAFGADIHEKALETLMIMKEQLAEKEQEIESLRENSLSKRIFKEKLIPSHCMEQYEKYEQQIDKLTQDKISFAVEQLEKVKEFVNDFYGEYSASVTTNFIDNQIASLKKEMK